MRPVRTCGGGAGAARPGAWNAVARGGVCVLLQGHACLRFAWQSHLNRMVSATVTCAAQVGARLLLHIFVPHMCADPHASDRHRLLPRSDSWGSDVSVYDSLAASVDRFCWDNPDFLSVFAAGQWLLPCMRLSLLPRSRAAVRLPDPTDSASLPQWEKASRRSKSMPWHIEMLVLVLVQVWLALCYSSGYCQRLAPSYARYTLAPCNLFHSPHLVASWLHFTQLALKFEPRQLR